MEGGYTTIDLVMLAIAGFIIWMVMRTPKDKSALGQLKSNYKSRRKGRRNQPAHF
jgi:hypothetical protein